MKEKILQFVGKYVPESYRTKVAGVALIMLGLVGFVRIAWPDMVPVDLSMSIEQCVLSISGGLGMIGIGRKIDKNTEAVKATAP